MTTALIGWLISAIDADICPRNATLFADASLGPTLKFLKSGLSA
jgi:hypothetical protein